MEATSTEGSAFGDAPDAPKSSRISMDLRKFPKLDNDILVSPEEMQYQVMNPHDAGGYIVYEVRGVDSQGPWEGKRRYNEFFMLRESLINRWPAIPIPFLPEKKVFGNKDLNFLQDRTFYLMRFLQKLSRFPFIIESPEMLMFSRPSGPIEAGFKQLQAMTTLSRYKRLKSVTGIDESKYDKQTKDAAMRELISFKRFIKTIEPLMNQKKVSLQNMLDNRDVANASYGLLAQSLRRYEDQNMSTYLDFQTQNLCFMHTDNTQLPDEMEALSENLHNPYIELYHWAKGEVFDLYSVNEVIKSCVAQFEITKDLKTKLQGMQKDIKDIHSGNTTLTTLFKNPSHTTGMANKVEQLERDIEWSQLLAEQMTIYVVERVMPVWRTQKLELYKKVFTQFHTQEIQNANMVAKYYTSVLKNERIQAYSENRAN